MKYLQDLQDLVTELNTTNSSNDKMEILKKYPQCKKLLEYVYSPFKQFGVTSSNLIKRSDLTEDVNFEEDGIFELLDLLWNREITGHKALSVTNGFINKYGFKELIHCIIDKNLKTRTDAKLINKVFKGCVPEFSVALAHNYRDFKDRINLSDGYFASMKIDGVRCIVVKKGDNVRAFSRTGKEFFTVGKVLEEIKKLPVDNAVFDGELCLFKDGKEDFQSIMKEIRKKDHEISNPKYMMFDMLSLEEFEQMKGDTVLEERIKNLYDMVPADHPILDAIFQQEVIDEETLLMYIDTARTNKWEGLILRRNTTYEGKRSKNLLKIKQFMDAEYVVEDLINGDIRIIDEKTGLEQTIQALSAVVINHKGYKVKVGSGWSLEERKRYYDNPKDLLGKTINVQYFEETVTTNNDNEESLSLRFPTVKAIYESGRDT